MGKLELGILGTSAKMSIWGGSLQITKLAPYYRELMWERGRIRGQGLKTPNHNHTSTPCSEMSPLKCRVKPWLMVESPPSTEAGVPGMVLTLTLSPGPAGPAPAAVNPPTITTQANGWHDVSGPPTKQKDSKEIKTLLKWKIMFCAISLEKKCKSHLTVSVNSLMPGEIKG